MRCPTWRPTESAHRPSCAPGTCRKCWRPCASRVKGARCAACYAAASTHPDPAVRVAAIEASTPERVLTLLATDTDMTVSMAAAEHAPPRLDPITIPDEDPVWGEQEYTS